MAENLRAGGASQFFLDPMIPAPRSLDGSRISLVNDVKTLFKVERQYVKFKRPANDISQSLFMSFVQ